MNVETFFCNWVSKGNTSANCADFSLCFATHRAGGVTVVRTVTVTELLGELSVWGWGWGRAQQGYVTEIQSLNL